MAETKTLRLEIAVDDKGSPVVQKFAGSVKSASDAMDKAAGGSIANANGAFARLTGGVTNAANAVGTGFAGAWNVLKGPLAMSAGLITSAATAAFGLASHVANAASEVEEFSRRLGISTEFLTSMRYAAEQEGVSVGALNTALEQAQRRFAEAADGSGEAKDALEKLGIATKGADGAVRSIEAALPEIAEALKNVDNDAQRTALAYDIFGRSGTALLQVTSAGAEGLEAYRKKAEELGIVMDAKLAKNAKTFSGEMTNITSAVKGVGIEIAKALIPAINEILPKITAWVVQMRESSAVHKTLIPLLTGAVDVVGWLIDKLNLVQAAWAAINVSFNVVVSAVLKGVGWIVDAVGGMIQGFANVAKWVGFDTLAEKLGNASRGIGTVADDLRGMAVVAKETADEWWRDMDKAQDATEKLNTEVAKTPEKLDDAGDAASRAGAKGKEAAEVAEGAWKEFGLKAPEELKEAMEKGIKAFDQLAESGKATQAQLGQAAKDTAERMKAVYGDTMPADVKPGFDKLVAIAKQAGLEIENATKKTEEKIATNFENGTQRAIDAWDKLIETYKKNPMNDNKAAIEKQGGGTGDAGGSGGTGDSTGSGGTGDAGGTSDATTTPRDDATRHVTRTTSGSLQEIDFAPIVTKFADTRDGILAQLNSVVDTFGSLAQRATQIGHDSRTVGRSSDAFLKSQQQALGAARDELLARLAEIDPDLAAAQQRGGDFGDHANRIADNFDLFGDRVKKDAPSKGTTRTNTTRASGVGGGLGPSDRYLDPYFDGSETQARARGNVSGAPGPGGVNITNPSFNLTFTGLDPKNLDGDAVVSALLKPLREAARRGELTGVS